VRGEGDELKLVREILHDLFRADADGAGRAEEQNALLRHENGRDGVMNDRGGRAYNGWKNSFGGDLLPERSTSPGPPDDGAPATS